MKNPSILHFYLVFFGLTFLREVRESIYSSISLALLIINIKMIPGELLGPLDLTYAEDLCIYEPIKVVVVGEDEDLVIAFF